MAEDDQQESGGTEDQSQGDSSTGNTTTATKEKPAPPWGSDEEFDPDKAWKLIQNLRAEKDELKPLAQKAKELEDAQKTEAQKLSDALDAAKADSTTSKAEAARLRAAMKHGLSLDDLDLLGTGTPEEIEGRAERLSQRLAGAVEGTPVVPSSRNQGRDGAPAEETDPRKLAADLPRY